MIGNIPHKELRGLEEAQLTSFAAIFCLPSSSVGGLEVRAAGLLRLLSSSPRMLSRKLALLKLAACGTMVWAWVVNKILASCLLHRLSRTVPRSLAVM